MRTNVVALNATISGGDLRKLLSGTTTADEETSAFQRQQQRLYPVLDAEKRLLGVVTRQDLEKLHYGDDGHASHDHYLVRGVDSVGDSHVYALSEVMRTEPVVAYADEPLRFAVYRMAEFGYTRFPVVDRAHPDQLLGILSLRDLLKARAHTLDEERRRERTLNLRLLFSPPRSAEPEPERELERV